jgi:transcriptional regulator with XRE-family HTH domain
MNRLREFRKKNNFSQWRLARESGCHQSRISLAELNLIELSKDEKQKLSSTLGVSLVEIFGDKESIITPQKGSK